MSFLDFILLFLAPVIGGILAILLREKIEGYYKLVLSFSGSFLFGVTVLHLFPEVFSNNVLAGPYILLGFFIQIMLEQLTRGIEHGHFHHHEENPVFIYSLVLGLSIHSFMDGVPVSLNNLQKIASHSLLYDISLHKIPEGFALASIFLFSRYKKSTVVIVLSLFALIAPAGALFSDYLQNLGTTFFNALLAIVAGSFLHISTTILFESESGKHIFSYRKIIAVILGGCIALLTI